MWILSKPVLVGISLIGAVGIILNEYDPVTLVFTFCLFCTLWAFILLCSRRAAFSLLLTWLIIGCISLISFFKYRFLRVSLSAFDFIFYLRNAGLVQFLSHYFLISALIAALIFLVGLWGLIRLYKNEPRTNWQSWQISLMLIFSVLSVYFTFPISSWGVFNYCLAGHRTSCFFASLRNVPDLFGKNQLQMTLDQIPSDEKYQMNAATPPFKSKPDIIVVLVESGFNPSLYPAMKAPQTMSDNFKAADGKIHALQTETYGGGTWITMTGLMASIPATEFGWMRPYINLILEDGIHHSLPQYLHDHGYATVAISPGYSTFLDEAAFLHSLGFEKYLDFKAIGANSVHEPDQFYFNYVSNYIEQHHKTDKRPLFLFFMTMGTHWPFDFHLYPTQNSFGNDEDTDEFLRRLIMLQHCLQDFKEQLKTITTQNGAFVVDFGDHQPVVTRQYAEAIDGKMALANFNSIAYQTYFNITPINTHLAAPLPDALHIMYLAPTLLTSANLPLDEVYQDLITIRDRCEKPCPVRDLHLHYLKKLVNTNLLTFPH